MESSTSKDDWDEKCERVKEAFGGDYPDFWQQTIFSSGLSERIVEKWARDAERARLRRNKRR